MRNRLPAVLTLLIVCISFSNIFAQLNPYALVTTNYDTIKIASYNLLNYPNASSTRDPYFRRVIHSIKPDILVVQEMTSSAGVSGFLSNVLNYYQSGLYSTITFHDGPDTDNHLYFKSSKVDFISASYIPTALRDIAEYLVRILDTKDTIRLYSLHLKASQGYENDRLAEVTILRNYLNNLPVGTKFIIVGDYNIYTSSEPAFQKLIGSEADNDGRCKDPLNAIGTWNNNSAFKSIHTQSTRMRNLSDGGSTGGMDDRFDIILTSYSSLDNNIIVSSYTAFGNDGNHFNDSINRLPNYAVPDSVAIGLHYSSDHIPVFCNFKFEKTTSPFVLISPINNAINQTTSGTLGWQSSANASSYDVYLDTIDPPTNLVSSNQADTFYNYTNLNEGTTYYWKVIAKNGSNTTESGNSPWHFTTLYNSALGTFYKISPPNGVINQSVSGSLVWSSSKNAIGYDVYLDTLNPPVNKVNSEQFDTSYNYTGLQNSKTYYWEIVAKGLVDSLVSIDSVWSFKTITPVPSPFLLISPSDGALDQPIGGTLSWDSSSSADSYDVYLDTINPPVEKVATNSTELFYIYNNLRGGTTYYWKIIAKNIAGEITASNSPRYFTTIDVPSSPSNISYSNITTHSVQLTWEDRASNELGYRVYRADSAGEPYLKVSGDLPQNSTTLTDTGLSVNHKYFYHIVPFNSAGEGSYAEIILSTLANVPSKPELIYINGRSVKVKIKQGGNPENTEYAIIGNGNETDLFVQQDGTLQNNILWQTYTEWGGTSGIIVKNLTPCAAYSFSVKARNQDNIETEPSDTSMVELVCNSLNFQTLAGWNLISIPFLLEDTRKSTLFPNSISNAFAFEGSYVQSDTLEFGKGYWLKFSDLENINLTGIPTFNDTFFLKPGWNLIGSVSIPISVNSITSIPADNVSSSYYHYNGVYQISDSLYPTYGYWVKAKEPGKIVITSSSIVPKNIYNAIISPKPSELGSLIFEDMDGHRQTLYLIEKLDDEVSQFNLPPLPPDNSFDVRFESQSLAEFINQNNFEQRFRILIQTQSPVVMRLNTLSPEYKVEMIDNGSVYDLKNINQFRMDKGSNDLLLSVKYNGPTTQIKDFNLFQNYPNPFNPSTTIAYQVPKKSQIKITIYNAIGSNILVLDEGIKEGGYYSFKWSPEIAGGIYFVRLDAIPLDHPEENYHIIKKLTYLK